MKLLKELTEVSFLTERLDKLDHELDIVDHRFEHIEHQISAEHGDQWDAAHDAAENALDAGDAISAEKHINTLWRLLHHYGVNEACEDCWDLVLLDESGNVIEEAAVTAFQRKGNKVTRKFRCMAGEKKGRLVSNPQTCVKRKSLARMLAGKNIAAKRKSIRIRKSQQSMKSGTSKIVRKMNKKLKHMGTRKPKGTK